jgi:hypothetical protein
MQHLEYTYINVISTLRMIEYISTMHLNGAHVTDCI